MPRDFYVWTFVFDIFGVKSVNLYYRLDEDGVNSLTDYANEVYNPSQFGFTGVGNWTILPMVERPFPAGNIFNWSGVNFFNMYPKYIATEVTIYLFDGSCTLHLNVSFLVLDSNYGTGERFG